MSKQHEPHTNDTTLTLAGLTGPDAYRAISKVYGLPLTWDTFVRALTFPSGGTDFAACLLLAWCLSWYNVPENEKPVFFGEVPYLDSRGRARDWNITPRKLRRAREAVSHAGLVVFEKRQHSCLVHIQWDAVAEAVRREADFRLTASGQSESRLTASGHSEPSRLTASGHSERSDRPPAVNTLLHSSPSYLPPSSEEEAETNEERVNRMLDYGRALGRSCDGPWVTNAHEAFDAVVADGHDPAIVEAAWMEYVGEKRKAATDLGHWLRGHDMHDEETDEGEWAFTACYERAVHRADREREAAGGLPKPNLVRTPDGWIETRKSLVVAPEDATREQAEAAWPEVWRRSQAS